MYRKTHEITYSRRSDLMDMNISINVKNILANLMQMIYIDIEFKRYLYKNNICMLTNIVKLYTSRFKKVQI